MRRGGGGVYAGANHFNQGITCFKDFFSDHHLFPPQAATAMRSLLLVTARVGQGGVGWGRRGAGPVRSDTPSQGWPAHHHATLIDHSGSPLTLVRGHSLPFERKERKPGACQSPAKTNTSLQFSRRHPSMQPLPPALPPPPRPAASLLQYNMIFPLPGSGG